MIWKCTNLGKTLAEIIPRKSGMSLQELTAPKHLPASGIQNMQEAAMTLLKAIKAHVPITIFGDYDADGISSTVILTELLREIGGSVSCRLPRRMSEGYGISMNAVNEIERGVLVTVDNGITATEEIRAAKEKGLTVVILDHHLPAQELPKADVIVNPHIAPEANVFEDYCGAGLSLKLEEAFIHLVNLENPGMYWRHLALAAIATIADVVPLRSENRWIVQKGLNALRHYRKLLPPALTAILDASNLGASMTETDIGFKVAPILNAAGRMEDNGASLVVEAMLTTDPKRASALAQTLIEINEERKNSVKETMALAKQHIADECLYGDVPLTVFIPNINEGVVGIVTGKLAEEFKVPAFVFTNSFEDPTIWKGSGRSYGGANLKTVVDAITPVVIRAGGHVGAAGVTVRQEQYGAMVELMQQACADYEDSEADTIFYDLEIDAKDIPDTYAELRRFAPFGDANPAPLFKIKSTVLSPRAGEYYKRMGAEGEHLKLLGNGFSAIGFNMYPDFERIGMPKTVNLLGSLSWNQFRYTKEYQVELSDIQAEEKPETRPNLLSSVKKL